MESAPLLGDVERGRKRERSGNTYGTLSTQATVCDEEHSSPGNDEQHHGHDVKHRGNGQSNLRSRLQMPILCYARMMEPLAYDSIFPYIAQMTQHNGHLPPSDVGFYSGMFESLFAGVQVLVVLFWGSMADRVGHKRMLVCALAGMAVGPALFGLSTSLWQMALCRCLTGAFSGSNVIVRAMLMLRSSEENRSRIFGWYTFADQLSLFIGPVIGGALADPVGQYSAIFQGIPIFERYPYALPGFVTASICASGALATLLFIDEGPIPGDEPMDAADAAAGPAAPASPSFSSIIATPGVFALLGTMMQLKVLAFSMLAITTTVLPTPVGLGGMAFSARGMAAFITAQGVVEGVWVLGVFPPLHRRVGTRGILYISTAMYMVVFSDFVAANELLRAHTALAHALYRIALAGLVIFSTGVYMGAVSSQVALQNLSPDPRALGTLNGLAEACYSLVKTVVPAVSTTLFAIGVRGQILGGHLVWVILLGLCPLLLLSLPLLPRGI